MANRLQNESSPYLRQHAGNPVDWYPWSSEALEKARTENKPILLSVGYSACHWCHVMAHECFEDPEIASIMNAHYVNIKVDREERPDLDQIYQNVAQLITRGGGWPLTVFLTPELKPFFGGTYFPPSDKYGRPGFPKVLQSLAEMFRKDPKAISENAQRLTTAIDRLETIPSPAENERPSLEGLKKITHDLLQSIDWDEGGFGGAPKFPNTMNLSFFWRWAQATGSPREQEAVILTLTKMACGGIYDQLGGGFSRYSVDDHWAVPHFEKMLYDNALLLKLYAEVLLTENPISPLDPSTKSLFQNVISETVQYVLREMLSPEGAFFAAQDADSEGEEGKYFIWSLSDLKSCLTPEEAQAFAKAYGVTEFGNFEDPHVTRTEGQTVLSRVLQGKTEESLYQSPLVLSAKLKLFEARQKRVAPGRDDKILTSWNGLMISGLLWAAQALDDTQDKNLAAKARQAALSAFEFVTTKLTYDDNRLWSVHAGGKSRFNGYLDDYAFMSAAALDVARLGRDPSLTTKAFQKCQSWIDVVLSQFKDPSGPGYFFTSTDHEALIQRPKTLYDQAIPSGIAMTIGCLVVLAEALGNDGYEQEADEQSYRLFPMALKNPFGLGEMSCVSLARVLGPVLLSGPTPPYDTVRSPHLWIKPPGANDAQSGILVCHNKTCSLPLSDPAAVKREATQHLKLCGDGAV